jgi:hypothetical protein
LTIDLTGLKSFAMSEQEIADRIAAAAQRALAEAEARRAEEAKAKVDRPKEIGGRGGLEPTRYGDWERKGIISDF